MEKKFTSGDTPLSDFLDLAGNGELQLPDFQRSWVWDDNHIASLLASVSLSYPIGAVMTLETGNPDVRFKPRTLEGVSPGTTDEPKYLLLDGQQRTTSLFLALRSGKPVATRDARKNPMKRRYFIDIAASIDPDSDREDAIMSVPADGLVKTFRGDVSLDVSTRDAQLTAGRAGMFPLDIVLDSDETMNWQLDYLAAGEIKQQLSTWKAFNDAVIKPFTGYQVPTIQLLKETPKEAVCQVFEKVNTGGVGLTVFELLTATYAVDGFNLRADWYKRKETFAAHKLLDEFDATAFLQAITLLATRSRRAAHLQVRPDDERAPAVSAKRRDMLRLPLSEYQEWADSTTKAMASVVRFLHGEHVYTSRDLPYTTHLVPLAAIMTALGGQAESHGVANKLRQWFWCGVFGELYGGATETRFANDLQDVVAWITGETSGEPRTVRDSQFQAERLLTLRTRNSAAYKGMYALQMKRGGRDFRTGLTIDVHAYLDDAIDVHHIFPQKWCSEHSIPDGIANSIVNKTAIDAKTNRRIGGNAPTTYLGTIESVEKTNAEDVDQILSSHDIDPLTLRRDDFPAFFNARYERLLRQIEEATGKPVNRSANSASPYADNPTDPDAAAKRITDVIAAGESKVVEFKSTGRKNLRTGERDPAMEYGVIKSLAGFMNSHGGTLMVGVADDGRIVGLEEDYPLLGKKDSDGWELWLTDLLSNALSKAAAADVLVFIAKVEERTVARIDVGPAARPVFARTTSKTGEKKQTFLVRINNSTQELSGQEAHDYQRSRWPA